MKKIILSLLLVSFGFYLNAQIQFHHGAGIGYFYAQETGGYAISYAPRLNLAQLNNGLSVSINAKPGASFNGSFNSREGGSGSFGYDLPIFAAVNFGQGATFESDANFGGYLGTGYSISSFAFADDFGSGSSSGGGLLVIAGTRFFFKGQPVGINFSYTLGSGEKQDIFGLRFMYYFGEY